MPVPLTLRRSALLHLMTMGITDPNELIELTDYGKSSVYYVLKIFERPSHMLMVYGAIGSIGEICLVIKKGCFNHHFYCYSHRVRNAITLFLRICFVNWILHASTMHLEEIYSLLLLSRDNWFDGPRDARDSCEGSNTHLAVHGQRCSSFYVTLWLGVHVPAVS